MNTFFAFLRGINVGGKNIIPVAELRHTIVSLGFTGVRTWIASGNVRFETNEENPGIVKQLLERTLSDRFSYCGPVILRREEELIHLVGLDPFHGRESGRDLFLLSRGLKGGRYGFPTIYVEQELGVLSTARNWNTIKKTVRR